MATANLKTRPKKRTSTIIKVKRGKSALVKVTSPSGKTVVKADTTKGRIAMKKAMANFKKERHERQPDWQADVCTANG